MGIKGSSTRQVFYNNVKVPVENLIGNEDEGFKYIMTNFNHERLSMCMYGLRSLRLSI